MLGVSAAYLSLPFMRGIGIGIVGVTTRSGGGGGDGRGREVRYCSHKTLLLRCRLKILLSYCYHFFMG